MMRKFTRAVVADFAEMGDMIGQTLGGYWRELGELGEERAHADSIVDRGSWGRRSQ